MAHPFLFIAYLIVGPGVWVLMFLGFLSAYLRMNRLKKPAALPQPPPHVTVLIPAKDEESRIAGCIERVLEQDYPDFDIVAIDDRSTDRTGVILDELARETDKLHTLHMEPGSLPPGWLGKCHALTKGERLATGQWLLFVDSDVTLAPNALSRALSVAIQREYDAISILTRLECHSFLERLILPMAAATWSMMNVISHTNDDDSKTALANGQFFLIRRNAYEKVGGHEAVRNQITEDVELMRRLKGDGFVVRLLLGGHLASTRMHSNLRQMFHGWARIYSGTSRRRPWRILAAMIFLVVCGLSVYPSLIAGLWLSATHHQTELLIASATHAVLMTGYLALIYQFSGNAKRYAGLYPLSAAMMLAILAFALRTCQTAQVKWRDTLYGAELTASQNSAQSH